MRGLKQKLYFGRLMMGESPKSVPAARGLKVAAHLVQPPTMGKPDLYREIVPLLKEKINLKRLDPPLAGSIGGYLIEVDSA
jgi:hypothetical protein